MTTTETEVKLRVESPETARQALARLGATLVQPREFEDNVLLDDSLGSLVASGKLMRLRSTSAGAVLTFKGPSRVVQGTRSRVEIEARILDPDALRSILEGIGLRATFRYQKYRETYAWSDVEIVLDETPLGSFLEIEGRSDAIHAAATALGYGPSDYLTASYVELFFASGGVGHMVFR
jgi:adenylate cyclase class 2